MHENDEGAAEDHHFSIPSHVGLVGNEAADFWLRKELIFILLVILLLVQLVKC